MLYNTHGIHTTSQHFTHAIIHTTPPSYHQDVVIASLTPRLLSATAWQTSELATTAAAYVSTASAGCGGSLDSAAAAQQLKWLATASSHADGALAVDAAAMRAALHQLALAVYTSHQAVSAPLRVLLEGVCAEPASASMISALPLDTCATAAVVHAATRDAAAAPPLVKAAQLRCLAGALHHRGAQDTAAAASLFSSTRVDEDWRWLAACWAHIVSAHRESLPPQHQPALDHVLEQLSSDVFPVDVDAIAPALQAATHPLFATLVDSHLLPALQLLRQWRVDALGAELVARGEAWALVGGCAMQLLVPPAGVDPARAASMQLDVLQGCWGSVQADLEVCFQDHVWQVEWC